MVTVRLAGLFVRYFSYANFWEIYSVLGQGYKVDLSISGEFALAFRLIA
jgi:hypothetical protein